MVTLPDLLIGLLPFVFAMLLLWVRLRAADVPAKAALKLVAAVFALVLFAIWGLWCVVEGWRGERFWLLMVGATVAIFSGISLRLCLARMWEKFPLPSNGDKQNNGDNE
ncbi:MAG: hypothetical protein N2116_02075 [Armatimonadetes bacterium]|nr:hypothetical protein [Armatimonadota bacterium]